VKLSNDIGAADLSNNFGQAPRPTLMDMGSKGFVSTGQFGPAVQVRETVSPRNTNLFPATTGIPGGPTVRQVDAFRAGPGGTVSPYKVTRAWTFGF